MAPFHMTLRNLTLLFGGYSRLSRKLALSAIQLLRSADLTTG